MGERETKTDGSCGRVGKGERDRETETCKGCK